MHKDENTGRRRPSRSSLSGVVAVVMLYRFSRQRMRTRHNVTPFPLSSPSLHCSLTHSPLLCWIYASEREVIRKSCPSGTNSILPPSPRSNNRQFMRRAPLLFTPKRRPPSLPLSPSLPARLVRPSPVRRLAMHEESDEIPLPLSLASYSSSSSLGITMCGTPKREGERAKEETLSSPRSLLIHPPSRRVHIQKLSPVRFRSFVYSYVRTAAAEAEEAGASFGAYNKPISPTSCSPPSLCHCLRRASSLSS